MMHSMVLSGCKATSIRSNFLDRTGPIQPSQLTWVEPLIQNSSTVTASWTPSSDTDLASQKIQFYQGAACDTPIGSEINLSSITSNTQSFTASIDGAYTYKIISGDQKGNASVSDCSAAMVIDTTSPDAVVITLLTPSTPVGIHTATTPTFRITNTEPGATVTLYSDQCSTAVATASASSTTLDLASSAITKGSYQFYAKQTDAVGNVSPCSTTFGTYQLSGLPMISTWQTSSANETITLPLRSGFNYNALVDWGDGTTSMVTEHNDPDRIHSFASGGTKTIKIYGTVQTFAFNGAGDKSKILSVEELGNLNWIDFHVMFQGCSNLTTVATSDGSFLANVIDMSAMFYSASNATPDTSNWNTSSVTNMSNMFAFASAARPDTSGWNTASVTNMSGMFFYTGVANPMTTNWNTSNVTDMSFMFHYANTANPDTTHWNTSNVTNMKRMFSRSAASPNTSNWNTSSVTDMSSMFEWNNNANPDTSNWNTANVTNMSAMFYAAFSAAPNTTNWNTANVTNMSSMFYYASSANPVMSNWNLGKVTNFSSMFGQSTSLTTANYDGLLNRIVATSTKTLLDLNVVNVKYSTNGQAARSLLTTSIASGGRGWYISDGGLAP